jgi:hypothetical protein
MPALPVVPMTLTFGTVRGAPYYDNGQESEGRALVYHGSANGL